MKCPGQDTQYWKAGAIFEAPCPECGAGVEFFKDDTSRKCPACGHRFINPNMDFGCASYCQYAEQCLGDLPPELVARKEDLFKDRVAVAVKRYLKNDFKTIGRAVRRARHAEQIAKGLGVNPAVVLMASYLWELDRSEDSSGEDNGLPVAAGMLRGLMAPQPLIRSVCDLLAAGRRPGQAQAGRELKVVLEADARVNAEDQEKAAAAIKA